MITGRKLRITEDILKERNKITASDLLKLLKEKHYKDIIVSECKNGPTSLMTEYIKLDAWVLKKQCRNPLTIGYEIKTSRSDFLNDSKWRSYLNYCNEFYFVCPPHVIEPNELPKEAGLYWCSKNCARLYNKKLSVYREIELSEDFYRYILMWRVDIRDDSADRYNVSSSIIDSLKFWKDWLAEKDEKKTIGGMVSKKLQTLVLERIEEVDRKNELLERNINKFEDIRKFIEENNIHFGSWTTDTCRDIMDKIEELKSGFSKEFRYDLNKSIDNLLKLRKHIESNKDVFLDN